MKISNNNYDADSENVPWNEGKIAPDMILNFFPNSFASYFGILKCRQLMGYSFMKLQQQQHGQEK